MRAGQLLDELMALLDTLGVWDTEAGHGWTEMVHLGFHILLTFASQLQLDVSVIDHSDISWWGEEQSKTHKRLKMNTF